VVRALFLWLAGNRWMATHLPQWGFTRRAVRRFLPGEGFDSALAEARRFQAENVGALFTRLGENVKDLTEAEAVVAHYEQALTASRDIHAEISVKPTQLGLDIDAAAAYGNLERLAAAAAATGSFLWIDMEGSAYTERTVEMYARLHADHPNTGLCLQAYLHRTAGDLVRLMPSRPAIRLVKGAYAEPPAIAFTGKREVDANYLALCVLLLPEVKRQRVRLVLGTHDVELVANVWRIAEAMGMKRAQLEVDMLYGIRTDQQLRLAREGFAVRSLIAYGDAWYAWYMRRLAERPANVLFVARQLLP